MGHLHKSISSVANSFLNHLIRDHISSTCYHSHRYPNSEPVPGCPLNSPWCNTVIIREVVVVFVFAYKQQMNNCKTGQLDPPHPTLCTILHSYQIKQMEMWRQCTLCYPLHAIKLSTPPAVLTQLQKTISEAQLFLGVEHVVQDCVLWALDRVAALAMQCSGSLCKIVFILWRALCCDLHSTEWLQLTSWRQKSKRGRCHRQFALYCTKVSFKDEFLLASDDDSNDVVDVDDDDPAIVRKARKLQQRVTNIRIYSDKRGEEVTHWWWSWRC